MMKKGYSISEKEWQGQIIELLHLFGWHVAHFRPAQTLRGWRTPVSADGKGFPDLLALKGKWTVWIECKQEGGRVTFEQSVWLDKATEAGHLVFVWQPHHFDVAALVLRSPGAALPAGDTGRWNVTDLQET